MNPIYPKKCHAVKKTARLLEIRGKFREFGTGDGGLKDGEM